MILIDNDSAKRVLGMADCIAALEDAYAEEVKGTAATRTKSQMHLPTSYSERWYRFSSTECGLAHAGVVAIRCAAGFLSWPTRFGQVRAYNYCMETRSFLRLGNSLQGRQWRAAGDFERRGHSASQGRSHRGHDARRRRSDGFGRPILTLDKIIEERLLKIAQQELRKEGKLGL